MRVDDSLGQGPGRYCSPRHRVPLKSRDKGTQCVSGVDELAGHRPGRYCSPRHMNEGGKT